MNPHSSYVPRSEAEREELDAYDLRDYPVTGITSDVVCFTIQDGRLCVLLVQRDEHPYQGDWALPGGFLKPGEKALAAAARRIQQETGAPDLTMHLEQMGTYDEPGRDPRAWILSVAHLAFVPDLPAPEAGPSERSVRFWAVEDLAVGGGDGPHLAFDHDQILLDGLERTRAKLEYTPLAAAFVGETFTISNLRAIYEAVWGSRIDPANFSRDIRTRSPEDGSGFLVPTGGTSTGRGRPAQVYKRGQARFLYPPLRRKQDDK